MTDDEAERWLKRVINGELVQIAPDLRTACRVLLEKNKRLKGIIDRNLHPRDCASLSDEAVEGKED